MISIKELNPLHYDAFMVYLTNSSLPASFTCNEYHPIWIATEGEEIKGFLSVHITSGHHVVLSFLKSDDKNIKDGLMRTALNSLYKKNIKWVLCHESFYHQSFPLKEHFTLLKDNQKLYDEIKNDSSLSIDKDHYYVVNASIIYETGTCKGGANLSESNSSSH
ncbi:MAG: hypothetical protein D5S00_10825 [Tindallia sp. MSAO_Bac2]|nr:MAG: hypothetical protein D5S00_10825 [Tindallia sp. MSAO_Bac2]